MKEVIKKIFPFIPIIVRNIKIKNKLRSMYILFKNNWIKSNKTKETVGYSIILDEHALEKGMTSQNPRFFGIQKVRNIMNNLLIYEKNNWEKDFAYKLGVSILHEYCGFYEKNKWTERDEYVSVKEFINNRKMEIKSGVMHIRRSDFISSAEIDYDSFLSSRHSFRNFQNKKLLSSDMEKIIKMVSKTPTACNRQMCKVYYVNNDNIKNSIIKYSHGLTNFANETVNIIVVTYDISALCDPGEIDQGMFNAGLVSMNLVNSMHSLGIGSCFLEFNDSIKEEQEYKRILNIPKNEKIAIVIAAGYYPNEAIIPCSTRKPLHEIYTEIV